MKMVKNKVNIITIFSITIFMTYSLANYLISLRAFAELSPTSREIEKLDREQLRGSQEAVIERPKREYRADDLRDPFRGYEEKKEKPAEFVPPPPQQIEQPLPNLEIQGVIWGGRILQAIINNKIVKIGDVIEGVQIVNINKDGITVLFGGKEYNLSSPAITNLEDLKGGKDEK